MRLRNITDARRKLEESPELIILDPIQYNGQWKRLFGNDNPIFLEIGMGKGQFICAISEQLPNINFLGLEKYDSVAFRALQRLRQNPRPNVILLRGDAENLLDYFAPNEIERIYINFSDPWPKVRNIKKRLTYKEFLDKYRIILASDCEIHFKTDNSVLFEFSLQHMNQYGMIIVSTNLNLHANEPISNIRTEYENSKSYAGSTIYQLVCKFKSYSSCFI
jgi:tRNA (guanine-N7-)-methyltransferase